jgi:hypothetical protein
MLMRKLYLQNISIRDQRIALDATQVPPLDRRGARALARIRPLLADLAVRRCPLS